jgi:hypothetical protein
MTQLLIDKSARELLAENRIREPIHARTLHVLDQLDEESPKGHLHKGALVRFLYKTELILERRPQDAPDDWRMLYGANLRGACLRGLRLEGADLRDADLSGADLSGANLNRAKITKRQLEQVESLRGATMPNGQKYEDWLYSKDSGENDGA